MDLWVCPISCYASSNSLCSAHAPIFVVPHGSFVYFHLFCHTTFLNKILSWVASCSKRLETVVFCSVEFLRFLRLFSCLCSLYDRPLWFLKAILVLVSSAHKCILLTCFSTTTWHLWLQFATRKASRENCGIWLGQMSSFLFPHFWPRQRFRSIPKLAVSELQKQIF